MGKAVVGTYDQDRFAEVQNDAVDENATLGTLNASFSKDTDTTFRVRLTVQQTATAADTALTITPTLFYSYNGGAYTEVGNPTDTDAPIRVVNEANVTDNAQTTLRLGSGDSNVAGRFEDTAPGATSVTFSNPSTGEATEYEWALQVYSGFAGIANDDTIALRVYNTATVLDTYTNEPTVTVTGLSINVPLVTNDIESATETSKPALTQLHALLSNDIESTSETSKPAVSQLHVLLTNDIESNTETSKPALTETHVLLSNDIESVSEVSQPSLTQLHVLLTNDIESSSEVSSPTLTENLAGHVDLITNDIESQSEVTAPTLAQVHVLFTNDIESNSEVSKPVLSENIADHNLLTVDIESDSEVSAPTLAQVHVLFSNDIECVSEVSSPSLSTSGGTLITRNTGGSGGDGFGQERLSRARRDRDEKDVIELLSIIFHKRG